MRTRRSLFRSLLSLTAALVLVTGVASVAAAAEPPTVGGTLSAEGKTIHVYSNGNVPAHVFLTATDVKLSEADFDIQPGETHSLTFSGPKAIGTVTALYVTSVEGQEQGSAALTLSLIPGKAPQPSPLPYLLVGGLTLAGFLLLLRRTKPWKLRLTRAT